MDSKALEAVIPAVITGGVTALAGFLLHRRKVKSFQNNSMVSNFQTLFTELRTDINNLREEQREERAQWNDERKELHKKVADLTIQVHGRDLEIVQLKGELQLVSHQFATQNTPAITVNTKGA